MRVNIYNSRYKINFENDEEKSSLLKKFNELKTIDDKIEFWSNNLNIAYYQWSHFDYNEIKDFFINSKNKHEIDEINRKTLKMAESYLNLRQQRQIVLNFEEIKDVFLKKYENSANKSASIEIEKVRINDIRKSECDNKPPSNAQSSFFNHAYEEYFNNKKTPQYNNQIFEYQNLVAMNNGYVIAKFMKYLDKLIEELATEQLADKKIKLNNSGINYKDKQAASIKQRLIIVQDLGMLKNINLDTTKIAKLLSVIFGTSDKNIRIWLSSINTSKVRTKKNLIYVKKLFEDLELTEHVKN
jgi:hypothetical protein